MSRAGLSSMIYGLPEPVLLIEPEGTIVAANPSASRLFRRPYPELVGEHLSALVTDNPEELIRYVHQCSGNSEGEIRGSLNILPPREPPIVCIAMGGLVRRERQPRVVWLRLLPRESRNNRPAANSNRVQAQAKQPAGQQNEQQSRTAFENSAIGITRADFEDGEANRELVRELAEGKRQHFEIEKRYCRKDGTLVWARANVALVPGMGAVEPFWFGVVEDITQRKHIEGELRLAQAELARVSRLTTMGELAASIAHEVNQPLTAVANNASACLRLLADRNLDHAVLRKALEEIVTYSSRASAVLARIRSFIKKAPAERNELDLNEVIQEVLTLIAHELCENRVLVDPQLTRPLPLVMGDRVQLQQVLLNLIINGIEAMTAVTDRRRLLGVQSRISESGNVLVAVSDSGTGLGLEADRVFTPFYTTKTHGMGMGLPISRSLIEGHGGRLWAMPNSPHGTIFNIALPVAIRSRS